MKKNMENPFVVLSYATLLAFAAVYVVKALNTQPPSLQLWMPVLVAGFLAIFALTFQLYMLSSKLVKQRVVRQ